VNDDPAKEPYGSTPEIQDGDQPVKPPPGGMSTGLAVVFYGILTLAAWLLGSLWLGLDVLEWHQGWGQPIWVDVALGAALGVVTVISSRILEHTTQWAETLTREFRKILGELTSFQVLVFAVTSGVAEEVFFRGFVQQALSELAFGQLPGNEWIGLVVASLVFGLIHIGPDRKKFLPWTIMAVVMGFGFGLLYMYTGNILAPVVAHFTINFFNLLHIAGRTDGSEGDGSDRRDSRWNQ